MNTTSYGLNDFYWLSWSAIHHALAQINLTDNIYTYQDNLLITDLKALLVHKNLQCFNGFTQQIKPVIKSTWKYGGYLDE